MTYESTVRWFRQEPRVPADHVLAGYNRWLERQALVARTRASYRRWVHELVREHLAAGAAAAVRAPRPHSPARPG